jgi:CRP-like cAMP-binding protein
VSTPNGRRTNTVRCKTDVQSAVIDYDQFKELYFQNPQFGFRLLHLVVARTSRELAQTAVSTWVRSRESMPSHLVRRHLVADAGSAAARGVDLALLTRGRLVGGAADVCRLRYSRHLR